MARLVFGDPVSFFEQESPFDLEKIEGALNRSVWLYACTYRLAAAVSSIEFKVINDRSGDEATGTKAKNLQKLLRRINPEETYQDWLEANIINLALSGETYMEKVRNGLGEVTELWTWRPATVIPIPDKTGNRRIAGYKFIQTTGTMVILEPEDVIVARSYNPNSPLRGMSGIAPIWQDLQADSAAARYNKSLLQKGARPGGVVQPLEGDLNEEEFRRLRVSMNIAYGGPDNAGKMLILPSGVKYDRDAQTARDMDFLNQRKYSRELAAGVIGVPPLVIGNFDSANYANAREQLRAFWDYVGKPAIKKIFGAVNEFMIHPEIDENLSLVPDMAQIDALVDSQTSRVQNVSTLVQGGVLTVNEGRKELGFKPLPDGDRLLLPLNLDPVLPDDLAPEPPEPVAPPPQAPPPPAGDDEEEEEQEEALTPQRQKARRLQRRAHDFQLRRAESKLAVRVLGYLDGSRKRFQSRLAESTDLDFVLGNAEVEASLAMRALAPAFLLTIQDAADLTMARLGLSKGADGVYHRKAEAPQRLPEILELLVGFDLDNPRVLAYLEEFLLDHVRDLSRRTIRDVGKAMQLGLAAGESAGELAIRLENLSAFAPARAERIARTETIGAFNLGAQEAFNEAATPRKSWLSTRDQRVRDSHEAIDRQTSATPIPTKDPFFISGSRGSAELMFPGDPGAPAWAVVNCRCTIVPEDEEERDYWVGHCKRELALIHEQRNGHAVTQAATK